MNISRERPGRREQRKNDRRQAIVEAARASFMEHGYAGTAMSGLLKTLGGSKATLWSYFRSKEELFAAVVEQTSEKLGAELGTVLACDADLDRTLNAFCRTFLDTIGTSEAIATWRMVMAEGSRFPELSRIFHENAMMRTRTALSVFLLRQIESGRLMSIDPGMMADTLISLCAGQQTRRLLGVEDGREADTAEYTRIFLSAYATADQAPLSRGS